MKKLDSLTIFFPCLNDGKTLPVLVAKAYRVAPTVAQRFDVLIVENGSTDDTPAVLTLLEKQYRGLRILRFSYPLGYGGTLRQGFAHSRGRWVFYTDGDGQYDPSELTTLVEKVRPGIDVVNGYKITRADPWLRRIAGGFYNWLLQHLYHPPIRDVDCDFRLIRRSVLKTIDLERRSGMICLELVLKLKQAGGRFAEVGVSHYPRAFGRSEFFRLGHLVRTLIDAWHYRR